MSSPAPSKGGRGRGGGGKGGSSGGKGSKGSGGKQYGARGKGYAAHGSPAAPLDLNASFGSPDASIYPAMNAPFGSEQMMATHAMRAAEQQPPHGGWQSAADMWAQPTVPLSATTMSAAFAATSDSSAVHMAPALGAAPLPQDPASAARNPLLPTGTQTPNPAVQPPAPWDWMQQQQQRTGGTRHAPATLAAAVKPWATAAPFDPAAAAVGSTAVSSAAVGSAAAGLLAEACFS